MTTASPLRRSIAVALLMLLACTCQGAWVNSSGFRGARPDIVLVAAILCSQFCSGNEGAAVGFFAGLLTASMAAPPAGGFGSLLISRTLACLCIGLLEERVFRDNAAIALGVVAGGTLLAEGAFFACDPHFAVVRWARGVGLETAFNLILTLPLYYVVKRCLTVKSRALAAPTG